ncbi:hypothetical protein EJ08DRAFT_694000 [Tothia fuscella]|uniref:Gag1-like clamp domain-containing protein n=1 Tax=Tothia fuscella TaxID=1048955 RepID=A0A9P4NZ83_9PEZI|nr:hypothetical protein EJ08DRAFT_694000 [Tothia fuscella]
MDKKNLAAAREVTRELKDKVLDDWPYPATTTPNPTIATTLEPGTTAPTYRERYYGTTDDSAEDGEDMNTTHSHTIEDMYAFDSPDSVGLELDRKLQERKRRKRQAMDEEMETNGGLRVFVHRRNAWTGAISRETVDEEILATALPLRNPKAAKNSSDSSPVVTPTSSTSRVLSSAFDGPPDLLTSAIAIPTTDVLIPVAEPIMPPDHPVRKTLSSRSHSDLYEKLVRDSRTPAIPINLSEMMQIVVQGWRDEGNWPPKGTAPEASIANRRNRVAKKVGMREEGAHGSSGGLLANHKHLRQSVEGVKRIFRLSGDQSSSVGPKSPKHGGGTHGFPHSQE